MNESEADILIHGVNAAFLSIRREREREALKAENTALQQQLSQLCDAVEERLADPQWIPLLRARAALADTDPPA